MTSFVATEAELADVLVTQTQTLRDPGTANALSIERLSWGAPEWTLSSQPFSCEVRQLETR
jgi:hypothetical protein